MNKKQYTESKAKEIVDLLFDSHDEMLQHPIHLELIDTVGRVVGSWNKANAFEKISAVLMEQEKKSKKK